MAIGFFKNIPNIAYDFKSDGKYYKAKDLFRKVGVWSYLQENITGYEYYRIKDGERPDVTAARLYGDSTLYWTFFLVNENLQDLNDWPKSNRLFNRYINRKYSGICLSASSSTDIVSFNHDTNTSSKFLLGEKVSQSDDIYGYVTEVNPTFNRITLNSVLGVFTNNSTVTGADSGKSFTISSTVNEFDVVNHYVDSENLRTTISLTNEPVTNIQHERNLNEDKHIIRYIKPGFIEQVVSEFKEIVSQ